MRDNKENEGQADLELSEALSLAILMSNNEENERYADPELSEATSSLMLMRHHKKTENCRQKHKTVHVTFELNEK